VAAMPTRPTACSKLGIMVGIAGMVVEELVSGGKLFQTHRK